MSKNLPGPISIHACDICFDRLGLALCPTSSLRVGPSHAFVDDVVDNHRRKRIGTRTRVGKKKKVGESASSRQGQQHTASKNDEFLDNSATSARPVNEEAQPTSPFAQISALICSPCLRW